MNWLLFAGTLILRGRKTDRQATATQSWVCAGIFLWTTMTRSFPPQGKLLTVLKGSWKH